MKAGRRFVTVGTVPIMILSVVLLTISLPITAHAQGPSDSTVFQEMLSFGGDELYTPVLSAGSTASEVSGNIRPCVVRISCDGKRGSGVILDITDEEVVILTCRHVVEAAAAGQDPMGTDVTRRTVPLVTNRPH